MKLKAYIRSLHNRKIAVVGIGVSNTPLIRLLLESGCDVTACDRARRADLGDLADDLESLGAHLRLGEDYLQNLEADVIFRTPGVRPDLPELRRAVAGGAELTSEMEVFFKVCPCPIIGVTGSDGKTTTTSILGALLRGEGRRVHVGGNIGTPLLTMADDMGPEDIAVLELSSFQLMTMADSPHIALVTNITPNHLDVHRDMDEYVRAKRNILLHQKKSDLAVLNADNAITRSFAGDAVGAVSYFSARGPVENGVYLENGVLYEAAGGQARPVIEASEIGLPGAHNIENFMAAFATSRGLVSDETRRRVAREFHGVAHRLEFVRTFGGVRYYNDSIASSPTRTIAGLRAFDRKVILIAGGKDKGVSFDGLGAEIVGRVQTLVLTGPTSGAIRAAVENAPGFGAGRPEIIEKAGFEEAVLAARDAAGEGDVVLLSPACTSFDRFKNFEQRGHTFKDIVNGWEM